MTPTLVDKTVLLVEDNPGDARLIAELLKDAGSGVRLVAVSTLSDALDALAAEHVDAVILDLGLPDSTGLATFKRLQEAAPTTATIIMSGDTDTRIALQAVQDGAQDFLVKGRADGEALLRSIGYAIERKKADAAIADSEEKFRTIFEQSVEGKSITDAVTGEVRVNKAFADLIGYTREELGDTTTWSQLTYPEDVAESARQMDALRSGDQSVARFEKRYVRKDGSIVWVDLSSSLRRDTAGNPLYFITAMVDITARKRAERALRRSLEISESIAGLSRILVAGQASFEDIAGLVLKQALELTDSPYGFVSMTEPSTATHKMLAVTDMMPGHPPTHSVDVHRHSFPVPPDGEYPAVWGASINTGRSFVTNSPTSESLAGGTPEGHLPLTRFASAPVVTVRGVVGQVAIANARDDYGSEDLTILERLASLFALAIVKAEEHEALRQSEEDLRSAQAIARIGSYAWDIVTGWWTSSETLDDIFGIDEDYRRDLAGWTGLVHADDRDMMAEYVATEVVGKRLPFDKQYRVTRPSDGVTVWVHGHGVVTQDEAGNPLRLVGAIQDVTLRHDSEQEIIASNESLQRTIREVAEVMGSITETRDPYTQGHQVRVAEIAHAISVEMGLSPDDLDCIQMAALLHDIGKLGIPAEILSKPGQLSDVEMSLIREHPTMGHSILSRIQFPWPIADIVLQHHERCDGSGYPAGLPEQGTLMAARILAVSDVLEAMSSHRPYRPSLGPGAAITEISGHPEKYCSAVVDAAMALHERGELGI